MGKRGPKPKPKAIRVLEGNPGRLPMPDDDLEITSEMPAVMPAEVEIDEVAAAEWRRVCEAMPPEIYTALDVAALTMYAQAWSLFWKAQNEIDEHGVLVIEKQYDKETGELVSEKFKANPAVSVWKAASDNLLKAVDRLGLCPGVRAKLQLPKRDGKPGPKSKFSGLLASN